MHWLSCFGHLRYCPLISNCLGIFHEHSQKYTGHTLSSSSKKPDIQAGIQSLPDQKTKHRSESGRSNWHRCGWGWSCIICKSTIRHCGTHPMTVTRKDIKELKQITKVSGSEWTCYFYIWNWTDRRHFHKVGLQLETINISNLYIYVADHKALFTHHWSGLGTGLLSSEYVARYSWCCLSRLCKTDNKTTMDSHQNTGKRAADGHGNYSAAIYLSLYIYII